MNSILENFRRFSEGLVLDYVRIGVICYVIMAIVFLYAYLN